MRAGLGSTLEMTTGCIQYLNPDTGEWVADENAAAAGLCDVGAGNLLDAAASARQQAGIQLEYGNPVYDPTAVNASVNQDARAATGLFSFSGIPSPLSPSASLLVLLALFGVGYLVVEAGKR